MATLISRSQVYNEQGLIPERLREPFKAFVFGRHAKLIRFAEPLEKTLGLLGSYAPASDTGYSWPNRPTTAEVDQDYAKLYAADALLMYYEDTTSSGDTTAPVSGYRNRVRSSGIVFKTNGDDYPHSAVLKDRGAQVGDTVYVRGSYSGTTYEHWTYIKDFIGEVIPASIAAATAETTNAEVQGQSYSIDKIGGADNCITPHITEFIYDGLEDGDLDETYTVEVTQGSTDADFTTARLKVTSASGNDDVASVTPSAAGDAVIGTRGLILSFHVTPGASCSSAAVVDGVAATELVVGQKWRVTVHQSWTLPTATSSGTYTGDKDVTYVVEVTKGGTFDNSPEITCTTTIGNDFSGPTKVTAVDSAVVVGSKGVLVSFNGEGLCKGDKFLIVVTAEAEGNYQTIVLGDNMDANLALATDLDLRLYIKKTSVEIPQNRTYDVPNLNWDTDADTVTVNSNIHLFDSTWTDSGVQVQLPLKSATLYVEYRAWLDTFTEKLGSLSDVGLVSGTLGSLHPDNPLAWGVYQALRNSNGNKVWFAGVAADTVAGWTAALDLVAYKDEVYSLVPLTFDEDIHSAVYSHVVEQSKTAAGVWRSAFLSLQATETAAVLSASNSDDGEAILATLSDNPGSSGTQYTYLQVTSGNVSLTTTGVRAGDLVRFVYSTDGFSNETYSTFTIDEVVNEDTVILVTGHSTSVPTASKVEFWRVYTKDEITADLIARAQRYANTRICCVWPDKLYSGSTEMAGYFGCAILAGLRSAMAMHRSLRDVVLAGVTSASRTDDFLTAKQIRNLTDNNVWVLSHDGNGNVYSRSAVTTGSKYNVLAREESGRATIDATRFAIHREMQQFLSTNNVQPNSLAAASTQLQAILELLRSSGRSDALGGLLTDGTVNDVRYHVFDKDRLIVDITARYPFPHSKDIEIVITVAE